MTGRDRQSPAGGEVPESGQDESNKSLSLMGGVVRPEGLPGSEDLEFQSLKPAGKLLGHGTMLILMVFIVAAGSIYAMRFTQNSGEGGREMKDVEAKIEQILAKLSNKPMLNEDDPLTQENLDALFKDTEDIVDMFSTDLTQFQVPLEFLHKNPFVLRTHKPVVAAPSIDLQALADSAREKRMRGLNRELEELELQSVMKGAKPLAVINGKFLQPGQSIGSFTIKQIKDLTVVLENEDDTFVLKMADPSEQSQVNSSRRRR